MADVNIAYDVTSVPDNSIDVVNAMPKELPVNQNNQGCTQHTVFRYTANGIDDVDHSIGQPAAVEKYLRTPSYPYENKFNYFAFEK